jgi:3-oxoacyl-[acyl-carrier-protein] synthase-3
MGTGGYLPETILTNEQISQTVETTHEWIMERTGIRERRIAGKHETASSMAEIAARQALEAAGLRPDELDLIIVGSIAWRSPIVRLLTCRPPVLDLYLP